MPIQRMESEISWFHLPKILFSSLQLKLIGTAQRWAQKDAKHKKLLNVLCIVYIHKNLFAPQAHDLLEKLAEILLYNFF